MAFSRIAVSVYQLTQSVAYVYYLRCLSTRRTQTQAGAGPGARDGEKDGSEANHEKWISDKEGVDGEKNKKKMKGK